MWKSYHRQGQRRQKLVLLPVHEGTRKTAMSSARLWTEILTVTLTIPLYEGATGSSTVEKTKFAFVNVLLREFSRFCPVNLPKRLECLYCFWVPRKPREINRQAFYQRTSL